MYINKGREKIKRDEYTESNRKNIIFFANENIDNYFAQKI